MNYLNGILDADILVNFAKMIKAAQAEFLIEALETRHHRILALLAPEELNGDATPEFALSAIPEMTDEEIVRALKAQTSLQQAKFMLEMRRGETASKARLALLIQRVKKEEACEAEGAEAEEKARKAKEAEALVDIVLGREGTVSMKEAILFVEEHQQAHHFGAPDELEGMVADGKIRDMLTNHFMIVEDAYCVRLCFVTNKEAAEHLAKSVQPIKGRDQDVAYSFADTLAFLRKRSEQVEARKAEDEARCAARLEMAAKEAAENEEFRQAIHQRLAEAKSFAGKELIRHELILENKGADNYRAPDWKVRVINEEAYAREGELYKEFRCNLADEYPLDCPTEAASSALEALIAKCDEDAEAEPLKDARESVLAAHERQTQVALVHLRILRKLLEAANRRDLTVATGRGSSGNGGGTHKFTRGTPGNGVFTKHDPVSESRTREKREADRQRTNATKGKGGDGGQGSHSHKKKGGGK